MEAVARIREYTCEINKVDFLENKLVQDAVIRNIEIIGEAAKNIEKHHHDFAVKFSSIPWKDLYLMRNRVSHGYFSIDLEIVWNTLINDLPFLESQITETLKFALAYRG